MKYKFLVLIILFGLFGTAIALHGHGHKVRPTETWLEDQVPQSVGNYSMVIGPGGDHRKTYKMDDTTYQILAPYGIVCRVMTDGRAAYDTVLIASDNGHSFHDPRICFSSQYNEILKQEVANVQTQSQGKIPVTFLVLQNERAANKDNSIHLAAYCFRGPSGIHAGDGEEGIDLLLTEFKTGQGQDGAFYRFICQEPGQDQKEALLAFVGQYMDAIHATSGGKF